MAKDNTYKVHLEKILLQDDRFKDDNDELDGRAVHNYARKMDETLIGYLLDDDKSREKFFLKVNDALVFKASDFNFFLEQNKLDNSFTQYANQIGLTLDGKYLKDTSDIVLDFPYKDCVLEGGQSTEEGKDNAIKKEDGDYKSIKTKRKEIFYNNIIAKDEIDRLEEPKAFENIVKYTEKGEEPVQKFNRNEKGTITDNLLIKGNNLLALHSLKEEFKGKVKLIYIDPPYNTGNDGFKYNDNFNHSAWLTFIQNRLEVAKELLAADGFLLIQINDNELSYLKVLIDGIFGRGNFQTSITVKMSHLSGVKMAHKNKKIPKIKEHLLMFAKDGSDVKLNPVYAQTNWDDALERYNSFLVKKDFGIENCNKWERITVREALEKNNINQKDPQAVEKFKIENANLIFRTARNRSADYSHLNENEISKIEKDDGSYYFVYKNEDVNFASDKIKEIDGEKTVVNAVGDIWTDIGINNLSNEGGVKFRFGKKPEKLLERIIKLTTNKDDLVLDFFLGSGTTAAVAMKMKRQFIGVEQLEYNREGCKQRIINTINGEQSGVSKTQNWQGGGSFVYLEMAKNNENAKKAIEQCESLGELTELFDTLYKKYFLHYNVNINEFRERIIQEEAFQELPLARQKEMFCRMLDNNQMYVNRDEMEDEHFHISEEDIKLTRDFYQLKD